MVPSLSPALAVTTPVCLDQRIIPVFSLHTGLRGPEAGLHLAPTLHGHQGSPCSRLQGVESTLVCSRNSDHRLTVISHFPPAGPQSFLDSGLTAGPQPSLDSFLPPLCLSNPPSLAHARSSKKPSAYPAPPGILNLAEQDPAMSGSGLLSPAQCSQGSDLIQLLDPPCLISPPTLAS